MFGLNLRPYLAIVLIVAFAGSNAITAWRFHRTGAAMADARHNAAIVAAQAATMRAAELASRNEAARLQAEADADAKAKALEDLAYADPVRSDCGIGIDRVRRLQGD